MKPPAFDHIVIVATDCDMAVAALARASSEAKILAGGDRRKFNRLARAGPNQALLVGGSLSNMLEEKNAEEIQFIQVFSAAVVAGSRDIESAKRLIEFLASARASEAISKSGMEPLSTSG